jgi:hypothetical protein
VYWLPYDEEPQLCGLPISGIGEQHAFCCLSVPLTALFAVFLPALLLKAKNQ